MHPLDRLTLMAFDLSYHWLGITARLLWNRRFSRRRPRGHPPRPPGGISGYPPAGSEPAGG